MLARLEEQDAVTIPVHKTTVSGQMRCGGRCWSRREGGTSDSANCLGVEDPHHGSWKLQVRALVMAEFFLDPSRLRSEALMAARAHPSIPHLRKVAATNRERRAHSLLPLRAAGFPNRSTRRGSDHFTRPSTLQLGGLQRASPLLLLSVISCWHSLSFAQQHSFQEMAPSFLVAACNNARQSIEALWPRISVPNMPPLVN